MTGEAKRREVAKEFVQLLRVNVTHLKISHHNPEQAKSSMKDKRSINPDCRTSIWYFVTFSWIVAPGVDDPVLFEDLCDVLGCDDVHHGVETMFAPSVPMEGAVEWGCACEKQRMTEG